MQRKIIEHRLQLIGHSIMCIMQNRLAATGATIKRKCKGSTKTKADYSLANLSNKEAIRHIRSIEILKQLSSHVLLPYSYSPSILHEIVLKDQPLSLLKD